MARVITTAEVQKHKKKDSLWMIIHDDVYDVTKFLEEHPGGEDSLLDNAGLNATQSFEDVGHSEDARELLTKFKIGTLPEEEKVNKKPAQTCTDCHNMRKSGCSNCNSVASCLSCVSGGSRKSNKSWRSFDTSNSDIPIKGSSKGLETRFALPPDVSDEPAAPTASAKKIVCCDDKGTQAQTKPKKKEKRGNWKLYALAAVVLGSIAVGVMAYKKYA